MKHLRFVHCKSLFPLPHSEAAWGTKEHYSQLCSEEEDVEIIRTVHTETRAEVWNILWDVECTYMIIDDWAILHYD